MSLSNTFTFSCLLSCAPWGCQCFMVTRCHTRGVGDDKHQHSPLPAHLKGRNMETQGRDHNSFGCSFTVTHFEGNFWFFNYFFIIYDTVPLVCELFQLMGFCCGEGASLMYLLWTAINTMNTPHTTVKKQTEAFLQLLFIHFPSRCTEITFHIKSQLHGRHKFIQRY